MKLIDSGVKIKREATPKGVRELVVPAYVTEMLGRNPDALENFNEFSYSGKKDYLDWFEEAKTETTRRKRLLTALEWIAEGKTRHWKYQRK